MSAIGNESAPLERYGHNLTMLARLGAIAPLAGHDAVINRIFEVLQRRTKNSPVILSSDETRRWAIVAEVIRRLERGDAPSPLHSRQVIGLDYEALFTDLSDDVAIRRERIRQEYAPLREKRMQPKSDTDEEWAWLEEAFRWPSLEEWIAPTMALERLQSMFIAMKQAPGSFLLYVDHFHRLVGGELEKYPIDASNLLKPTLSRGQIQLIGACTLEQYRQYIERNAAIQRRCQEICLPESQDAF
jgi:ATP-dependent Clp protease ATP-binding subunit ClpA